MRYLSLLLCWIWGIGAVTAQVADPVAVQQLVQRLKSEVRGPYRDIRWFCPDGSTRPARDPCPDGPGNQHARLRTDVEDLARKEHLFLGQILTNTPFADFWDAENGHSRLMQYQLEQFLRRRDDGWIHRRARYYRGAVQAEDEQEWGRRFFQWVLTDDETLHSQYFLLRQSIRDIPHAADSPGARRVRDLSRQLADSFPAFQDLRVKIHGTPDSADIVRVRQFCSRHGPQLSRDNRARCDTLIEEMVRLYRPWDSASVQQLLRRVPAGSPARMLMQDWLMRYPQMASPADQCRLISETAWQLRQTMRLPLSGDARLALLDISWYLEGLLGREVSHWQPRTLAGAMEQIVCLSRAAAGFGYMEEWEWAELETQLSIGSEETLTLAEWRRKAEAAGQAVAWTTAMVQSVYRPAIGLFRSFEPLAAGYYDELVRGTMLLPLGRIAGEMGAAYAAAADLPHEVMGEPGGLALQGLNPGFARGRLIAVEPGQGEVALDPDQLYVFYSAPADLTPVAGLVVVEEGNLVSHVQLLARNLGIPNVRIPAADWSRWKSFHGQEVFMAVAPSGVVVLKPVRDMSEAEVALFHSGERGGERVAIPTDRIRLEETRVLPLHRVTAAHSGVICGPKAAHFAQLKAWFPEWVVPGLVLPFGIFQRHMEQLIPGRSESYLAFMQEQFARAARRTASGRPAAEVEAELIRGLDSLRQFIHRMPLLPDFLADLEAQFVRELGQPMGQIPVFVRSDTNMEDLKDFSGAGLNLTVFNAVTEERILQGIREVWASPYTARSYRWRQRYLLQPEAVYPSILIIPSVRAECSGVLLTTGLGRGAAGDLTVAFSRGVGGAVDGQAAETWLLRADGHDELLAPARERLARDIPPGGGSRLVAVSTDQPLLTPRHRQVLRAFAGELQGHWQGADGPLDVELGFAGGALRLFQVRPLVENRQAAASAYLQALQPRQDPDFRIFLQQKWAP